MSTTQRPLTIRVEELSASVAIGNAPIEGDSTVHYNASWRLADLSPGHETAEVSALSGTPDSIRFVFHNDYTFIAPDGSGNNNRGTVTFPVTLR